MTTREQASTGAMWLTGIGMAIGGVALILVGLGVLPAPGGREALHAPLWIALVIGVAVLLSGVGALIQGIGRASATGDLPADAPRALHVAHYLIGVALFGAFAILGIWIAFAGDVHQFSGGMPFLGACNVSLARVVFGLGAMICWLITFGCAVAGARKLLGRP